MKEWKIKQEIYHRLNKEYTDDLNEVEIKMTDNVYEDCLRHFYEYVDEWIYPSKSYFVAFCYAYWISQDYNEDMIELLNDEDLLAGNDPFFKTYDEDKEIYDKLFEDIKLPIQMNGMVPDVRRYYEEEIGNWS